MLTSLSLLLLPLSAGDVLLPEGPAARAWASVDPRDALSDEWLKELGEDAPAILSHPDPWSQPATWGSWGRWLASGERTSQESGALALLAARSGRPKDAWSHYAALVADPASAAAVMPRLLPGVPADLPPDAPLPVGSLLRPTPPPGALDAARGVVAPVTASATFQVGEAQVRLVISIERAGVEAKLHHLSGEPASLHVQLPELPSREVRVTYIDWLRQETPNDPLLVELKPGMDGPVHLFGRFMPREEHLPALPKERLPAQLIEAGLWLEIEAGSSPTALQAAAADAITTCLGVPGGVRRAGAPSSSTPSAGTIVSLSDGPSGARTLSRIAGATEAWINSR